MEEREYLIKAQEAEAIANALDHPIARHAWENIAREYRKRAHAASAMRKVGPTANIG